MTTVLAAVQPPQAAASVTPAAPQTVLSPGSVVSTQVLQLLENGLAQIAVNGIVLAALTEIPLQPGTTLQAVVSQAQDGTVRLRILPPTADDVASAASSPGNATAATSVRETIVRDAAPAAASVTARPPAVPPEVSAIATAEQTAAPRQASLAPLYANLPVITASEEVPQAVQASAAQLMALRPELSEHLSVDDLRQAFQQSGLFLEASLAGGNAAPTPDLKAALVIFRSVLTNWLGAEPAASGSQAPAFQGHSDLAQAPVVQPWSLTSAAAQAASAVSAKPAATPIAATAVVIEDAAPGPPPAAAGIGQHGASTTASPGPLDRPAQSSPGPAPPSRNPGQVQTAGSDIALLRVAQAAPGEGMSSPAQPVIRDPVQALQAILRIAAAGGLSLDASAEVPASSERSTVAFAVLGDDPASHVPPPFRGSAPSAQPVARPSVLPEATPHEIGQHLLKQTDAALARQTLLQIASLPDRIDAPVTQSDIHSPDVAAPRWCFEIPFATSQGTALAQFEIERDGGGRDSDNAAQRIWRARFTLDVEPTGPIHALVSLAGDKTTVRLWAERPDTAARLHDESDRLAQALRVAQLQPGEIAISHGAPRQSPPVRVGHFLDRAS